MSYKINLNYSAITHESLINYYKSAETSGSEEILLHTTTAGDDEYDDDDSEDSEVDYDNKYFCSLKQTAGLWGTYRVEDFKWANRRDKKFPKIRDLEYFELDENESLGILSDRLIAGHLSHLERCPEVNEFAFTKCTLSNLKLVDICALEKFHFIQYLDISANNLTSLEGLGQLPFLQYLDASENKLETLLDFKPPFYLSFVNFSRNMINEIPDLSDFWSITHLYLSKNLLTAIKGLQNLKFLCHLDLSENQIQLIENLENLRIQSLHLQKNMLEDGEDKLVLSSLDYLVTIDLSENNICSLEIFKDLQKIENINVSNNNIHSLLEITNLDNKRYLQRLDLSKNPVTDLKFYTEVCIRTIRSLRELDGEALSAEQRVLARNISLIDHLHSRENRTELLLLEQINHPKIGNHIFPWDQPPPRIIVFVGTPASKQKEIAITFARKYPDKLVLGVSHTTRPRRQHEIHSREYYFISKDDFHERLKKGEFIAASEFNGHSYGIAHTELEKGIDKIVVFHSDFNTALGLKLIGLSPILFLTVPKNEKTHMHWVSKAYKVNLKNEIVYIYNHAENLEEQAAKKYPAHEEKTIYEAILNDASDQCSESCSNLSVDSRENTLVRHTSILKNRDSKEHCDKKVSFTWFPFACTKVQTDRKEAISASESLVFRRLEYPVLSSISCGKLMNNSEKTVYMSVTERLERSQLERMHTFFLSILNERNNLLELHWENPGLFRDVIHTDEVEISMGKLKDFLKNLIETSGTSQELFFCFQHDPAYTSMVHAKLQRFDIEGNAYYKKADEI